MRVALSDLALRRIVVIYPGPKRHALAKNVEVVPVTQIDDVLKAA